MKTYKQRTDNILKKADKIKTKKRKILLGTVIPCGCAAFMAAFVGVSAAVLFTPYPIGDPTDHMAQIETQYAGNEYLHVIKHIEKQHYVEENTPHYKNRYEKWSTEWNNFIDGIGSFSIGCGAADKNAAVGGDMMGGSMSDSDMIFEGDVPESGVSGENGEYVESTDNQVAGVIEGDLLKRTDKYIFYLASYGNQFYLDIYDIVQSQPEPYRVGHVLVKSKENGQFQNDKLQGATEMYLSADGNTVTVLARCVISSNVYTALINLDVSNPAKIVEKGERQYFRGDYVSSRMVDGKILLVNNYSIQRKYDYNDPKTYVPHYGTAGNMECVDGVDVICPDDTVSERYTTVYEIDQATLAVDGSTAFLGYSNQIYVSKENIFLTRSHTEGREVGDKHVRLDYVNMTEISCVSYAGDGLEMKGSFEVEGWVKNQYSMDEYEGMLRVVTTTDSTYSASNASLYCVRLSDFETVGQVVGFAPDNETVESVRFDGVKAYVCTAQIVTFTDPVYAFDLTDPTNIPSVDTGVIEGYSSSLVNFTDGYLLGIGYGGNSSWDNELKLEIYKETETKVESVCSYTMSASFPTDYKAYYINRDEGLIGMAVYDYKAEENPYCYILWEFDSEKETLSVLMRKENVGITCMDETRAVLIDGYFYMVDSYMGMTVVQLPQQTDVGETA
ncbi:MAG: beta-propeller domain-containing protein [Clostridia bacterium]|nr:beta-propeller domain-containing protein [Clostridia bacterium]